MRGSDLVPSFVPGFVPTLLLLFAVALGGCVVAPTNPNEKPTRVNVAMKASKAKAILEKIQKNHPDYTIRALLKPEGHKTEIRLTVYTIQTVHMVVKGFQEPENGRKVYPDCNHWFDISRSFDPACGGGPYIGTANLLSADGMALGLMFDLFQAARYPFAYTRTKMPDEKATEEVVDTLRAAEKSAALDHPAMLARSSGQK